MQTGCGCLKPQDYEKSEWSGKGEATQHEENSFPRCDPQVHTEDRSERAYWKGRSSEARRLEIQDIQSSWALNEAPLAVGHHIASVEGCSVLLL